MIKNREIIQSIPPDKKLEMIADGNCLNGEGLACGVPRVVPASLEGVNAACGEIYPSFPFLAASWNKEIVSAVAGDLALRAKAQGANLLFTPEGKTKGNPYTSGVSEDPLYTAAFLSDIVKSVKGSGATPCIPGCALTDCDADYMDISPSARAIYEYVFSPLNIFSGHYGNVFMTSFTSLSGGYEKANCTVVSHMLHSLAGDGGFVICSEAEQDLSAESVAAGNAFAYKSDLSALKSAADSGMLSAEQIDGAVDKIVDFALYCNMGAERENGAEYDAQSLSLQAAEESIVLLKNDGVLPLKGGEKLGIVGQPAFIPAAASQENFSDIIAKKPVNIVGAAPGYPLSDGRDDALLNEAKELAKKCDTVLLFLGLDSLGEQNLSSARRLKLPADRLALIAALKDTGVKIVAVLTTAASVDVSFDAGVSALLTAPLSCARGSEALINILYGKSPCGKLANTLYADTDKYFNKIKSDRDAGRQKTGVFMGYRYYTTAGIAVKYPFGHGLSYTTFAYSAFSVRDGQVFVTVKNTGGCDGSETVQLYAGKPDSGIIRPVRELKSFIKVFLRAGEEKTLCFRITPEKLAVYSEEIGKNVIEGGIYNMYLGSSVNDIKFAGKVSVFGANLKSDGKKLCDYIPTVSNVVEGGYTLAPVQKAVPEGKQLKFAGLILMLVAVLGAIAFSIPLLVRVMSFASVAAIAILTLIILVFIAATVLLVVGCVQVKAAMSSSPKVYPRRYETVKAEDDSLDSLFEQEFGGQPETPQNETDDGGDGQDVLKYIEDGVDFPTAAQNLCTFFAERGINIKSDAARKILAAFASSRVILLKNANPALNNEFLKLLCSFFGVECTIENYEKCDGAEEFLNLGGGSVLNAIKYAAEVKQCVLPVCFENADIADIGGALLPFESYFKNPEAERSIACGGEIKLSHNIWFVFALSEKSNLADADIYTSELACVLDLDIAPTKEKEEKTEIVTLNYYKLEKLSQDAKRAFSLDEESGWKKIDKLEKFICSHTPFAIGNKTWQSVEKFVSAYIACGGEERDALDGVTAAKLMIMACANLNGKLKNGESILSAVEEIFGDTRMPETKKILKYQGAAAARRTRNAGM